MKAAQEVTSLIHRTISWGRGSKVWSDLQDSVSTTNLNYSNCRFPVELISSPGLHSEVDNNLASLLLSSKRD